MKCRVLSGVIALTLAVTAPSARADAQGGRAAEIPAGMGLLRIAGEPGGRRIFVDDRAVGQTPDAVTVKCGRHEIKIGSNGHARAVDVACGEETVVGAGARAGGPPSEPVREPNEAPASATPAPARASEPAADPVTGSSAAALPTRPSKPLELMAPPSSTPWPYKALFGALVCAGGVAAWTKRRKRVVGAAASQELRVVSRTATGLRGEIAVVEAGGMRILVGITPQTMTMLAVLPDERADASGAGLSEPPPTRTTAERTRSVLAMLEDAGAGVDAMPRAGAAPAVARSSAERYSSLGGEAREALEEPRRALGAPGGTRPLRASLAAAPAAKRMIEKPIEGQARGLALALGQRS
jgi:flagellar biogenesis protein FliO